MAQDVVVKGPDEKLQLVVFTSPAEKPSHSITYNGPVWNAFRTGRRIG